MDAGILGDFWQGQRGGRLDYRLCDIITSVLKCKKKKKGFMCYGAKKKKVLVACVENISYYNMWAFVIIVI